MSATNRRQVKDPTSSDPVLFIAAMVIAAVAVVLAVMMGALVIGTNQAVPISPFAMLKALSSGQLQWSAGATVVAAALSVLIIVATTTLMWWWVGRRRSHSRIDEVAPHLGAGRDIDSLTEAAARSKGARLGVHTDAPGLLIGHHVPSGKPLYGSWEDLHIDIWGPRTGKTTSRVIPAVLDAPGAVLTTSNKRDVLDATRDVRAGAGSPVWVFDPQNVAEEPATWWWNPLSAVTDEVKAAELAGHFAASTEDADARTDAFFDPEGRDLLAALILAAARGNRPITEVYQWVTAPENPEPVQILRDAGDTLVADGLLSQYNAPDKQRSGVFSTAKKMVAALKVRAIHPWITSCGPDDLRPQFDPVQFLATGGTLYSLSREGTGSAGALVTALTVAVIDAAESKATAAPGGRLPVPLVAALDEAANVVRWTNLPSLYSHYGSRGIVIMTILQSWSQGVQVWGERGMKKLWSAANIKVYGGGVAVDDGSFLRDMSTALGDHWEISGSISQSDQGTSRSRGRSRERTLTEDDLEALPRGRAIVRSSGNRPVLVATAPWMDGPHADAVRASIAAHTGQGGR